MTAATQHDRRQSSPPAMTSAEAMAQRIRNATSDFISTARSIAGLTEEEAGKVLAVYLRLKVAKVDPVLGRVHVKHGAYMEAAPMRAALDL